MLEICNLLDRAARKIFTSTPFAREVTDLATLRVVLVADGAFAASVRVEMGKSGSTVTIIRDSVCVNMVYCEAG
jgi:hypothetical protein